MGEPPLDASPVDSMHGKLPVSRGEVDLVDYLCDINFSISPIMTELSFAGTPLFNTWAGVVMGATMVVCFVSVYRAQKAAGRRQDESCKSKLCSRSQCPSECASGRS
jgi:hypothetical protein